MCYNNGINERERNMKMKNAKKPYPKNLTVKEWNLLQRWSEYSKLDTWFDLRHSHTRKIDYVYDRDARRELSLHRALKDFTEGIYIDKPGWRVTAEETETWNKLMGKFRYPEAKI